MWPINFGYTQNFGSELWLTCIAIAYCEGRTRSQKWQILLSLSALPYRIVDNQLSLRKEWPIVKDIHRTKLMLPIEQSHCCHWVCINWTVLEKRCCRRYGSKPHAEGRRFERSMLTQRSLMIFHSLNSKRTHKLTICKSILDDADNPGEHKYEQNGEDRGCP